MTRGPCNASQPCTDPRGPADVVAAAAAAVIVGVVAVAGALLSAARPSPSYKIHHFTHKIIIFNENFIIFNTKFVVLNASLSLTRFSALLLALIYPHNSWRFSGKLRGNQG